MKTVNILTYRISRQEREILLRWHTKKLTQSKEYHELVRFFSYIGYVLLTVLIYGVFIIKMGENVTFERLIFISPFVPLIVLFLSRFTYKEVYGRVLNYFRESKPLNYTEKTKFIWLMVEKQLKSIKLERRVLLEIRKEARHIFTPNTLDDVDGTSYLILPMNLIGAGFSPQKSMEKIRFDSVVSHELGHVIQADTRLWHLYFFYIAPILSCTLLPIYFVLVYMNTEHCKGYVEYLKYSPCLAFLLVLIRQQYKKVRHESELLADIMSIILNRHLGIIDFLRSDWIKQKGDLLHPSPEKRIENINKVLCEMIKIKIS